MAVPYYSPDEPPVDVLAAEEFALPAPHPLLKPERLELPTDLVGGEVRDVLAAEEFAIPAPDEAHGPPSAPKPPSSASSRSPWLANALIGLGVGLAIFGLLQKLRSR